MEILDFHPYCTKSLCCVYVEASFLVVKLPIVDFMRVTFYVMLLLGCFFLIK